MRILFIADVMHRQTHGPSRKLMLLREAIHEHHPDVELRVLTEDPSPLYPGDYLANISYSQKIELASKLIRAFRYWKYARQIYAQWPFTHVVFNDAPQAVVAALWPLQQDVHLVAMLNDDEHLDQERRSDERFRKWLWRRTVSQLESIVVRKAALIICCSSYLADRVSTFYGTAKHPSVLHPALDGREWEGFRQNQLKFDSSGGSANETEPAQRIKPVLLFVKSDPVRGGFIDLMSALSDRTVTQCFNSLLLAGFNLGKLKTRLFSPLPDLHLPLVEFGPIDREGLMGVLAKADIGVVASRHEAYGITVREFAAAGLTVVVSDAGGLPEASHDLDAISFRAGDVIDLKRALTEAADNWKKIAPLQIKPFRYGHVEMAGQFVRLLRELH